MKTIKKELTTAQNQEIIQTLKKRFEANSNRHKGMDWQAIQAKLEAQKDKLWSINEMELTGGEPDVIGFNEQTNEYIFCDCSAESPKGRRSLCYDDEALQARKEFKPANSAIEMAKEMGIKVLNETEYRALQELGNFDLKTSSWIETPATIRKLKGAVFCDRRYDTVFVYHNGAESYYAARGFRGLLIV
ncbi:DUF4256 domain-containing protein [Pedobacter yonginense]|uniref:DUF4256 domain-containing protein n=1 Tax=Pedobacter yonginense TaxID=651869 RepID=A0A317EIU6_9SPHI|nr:DUF4256 domain-containing protein [Pedobacter yonginense]PWS26484.1 DUF4256 domain-containing protein [Pedobacter yonginense]